MAVSVTGQSATLVLAERRGGVLLLTFNRPEQLNAWNDEVEGQYFALLAEADNDPEVRAIVITGAGRGFCSGADMSDLSRVSKLDLAGAELPERQLPRSYPMTIRKPMIAAINGAAAGLGLIEALYCDLRFAAAEAKLLTAFVRRGLIAEYGMAWLLPRIVGQGRALDLMVSSRIVKGEEALAMGLVDRVVADGDVVEEAVAYAAELATWCSPVAMSTIKSQVYRGLDLTFAEALAEADDAMLASFDHPDAEEGVHSFLEKRVPAFQGLEPRA